MGHGPGRTAQAVLLALAENGSAMTIAELTQAIGSSSDRGTRHVVTRLETRDLVHVDRSTSVGRRDDGLPVYGLLVSLPPAG